MSPVQSPESRFCTYPGCSVYKGRVACKNHSLQKCFMWQNRWNMSSLKSPFLMHCILHPFVVERGRGFAWRHWRNLHTWSSIYTHVNLCVVPGCSNTLRDHVSVQSFPIDPKLREKRVKQVRRTHYHAQWTATKLFVLCSKYFIKDSFWSWLCYRGNV